METTKIPTNSKDEDKVPSPNTVSPCMVPAHLAAVLLALEVLVLVVPEPVVGVPFLESVPGAEIGINILRLLVIWSTSE